MPTPKIFISYSWDSDAHKNWVRQLADQLIANGVNIILDQYEMREGDHIQHFMERAVDDTDMVLLILTENYKTKAEGRTGGVGYEYSMINSAWYQNQTQNTKFIPILRGGDADASTPIFLLSYVYLDMRDDSQYAAQIEQLLRRIYNAPEHPKPTPGKQPDFAQAHTAAPTPVPAISTRVSTEQLIQDARNTQAQEKESRQAANQLRQLIAAGKTDTAIQQLRDLADQVTDSDYQNQVIMQSTAYEQYKKSKRIGITSHSEQQVSLAKINHALLELINGIP